MYADKDYQPVAQGAVPERLQEVRIISCSNRQKLNGLLAEVVGTEEETDQTGQPHIVYRVRIDGYSTMLKLRGAVLTATGRSCEDPDESLYTSKNDIYREILRLSLQQINRIAQ